MKQISDIVFTLEAMAALAATGTWDGAATEQARLGQFVRAALLPDAAALRIRCQSLARIEPKDI